MEETAGGTPAIQKNSPTGHVQCGSTKFLFRKQDASTKSDRKDDLYVLPRAYKLGPERLSVIKGWGVTLPRKSASLSNTGYQKREKERHRSLAEQVSIAWPTGAKKKKSLSREVVVSSKKRMVETNRSKNMGHYRLQPEKEEEESRAT